MLKIRHSPSKIFVYFAVGIFILRIEDVTHFSTDNNRISLYSKENGIAFDTSLMGFFSSKSFIAVLHRLIKMSGAL